MGAFRRYVNAFIDTKFEPSGNVVGNDRILSASSILDYVFGVISDILPWKRRIGTHPFDCKFKKCSKRKY